MIKNLIPSPEISHLISKIDELVDWANEHEKEHKKVEELKEQAEQM